MKKSAYIVSFFILTGVFVLAYFAFYRYAGTNMDSDNIKLEEKEYSENPVLLNEESTANVSSVNIPQITNKTLYLKEYIDEETAETTINESVFTPEYFGMDRAEFLETLESNEILLSFNTEQVAVRVINKKEETKIDEVYNYYIVLENNKISVYKSDKETLYFNSTIKIDALPIDEIAKLTEGIFIKDVNELYNFLESHTS